VAYIRLWFLEDTAHDSHPNFVTGAYVLRLHPSIIIVPGFLWTHASDYGHKEVNVQVDTDRCRRLGDSEKSAAEIYSSTLVSIYQYTRCNVPKDGKYSLSVCVISTSYEYLCVFVLQKHTDVKVYSSREVVMDML
jgi:hypothetical protein